MSECNWDPSKHGGKPCPVHGGGGNPGTGGHKIRINGGKYQVKLSDDADWEDTSSEEWNDLREGGYQEFDETVDDDFGFDENELDELHGFEDNFTENDIKEIERYAEHYDVDTEKLKQKIWDNFNEKIKDGASVTNAKNDAMEEVLDDVVSGRFDENDEAADPVQQGLDYIKKHYSEQEFGSLQSFMEKRMNDWTGKEKAEIAEAYKNSQSSEDKYSDYEEKGKSTWNQKLNKGDKVTFKDKNGNETVGYISGFYRSGELQDVDTYEEGKHNLWHDFRGIGLVDEEGHDIGNINANQILKHESVPERSRISLEVPKYHTEPDKNGGTSIVIDEGRFKGNRYADESDFSNTENANEEAFRDRLLKFMKDNGHDVDDKWFDEYPEENKQSMREYFSDKDARDALMNEAEKPENRKKIIEKAKEARPWYNNPIFTDDEIWKALSYEDIRKFLGK